MFTGIDSQSTTESNQWHVLPVAMTFHHFYCTGPLSSDGSSMTFTIDITTFTGSTSTTRHAALSCVIPAGQVSGVGTGHVTFSAGQAVDVLVSGGSVSEPTTAGGVSWGLAG